MGKIHPKINNSQKWRNKREDNMSGGRRIDDHSFWAGSKPEGTVFPNGPHKLKMEHSAESAGSVMSYEDTTEKIKEQQSRGAKKVHSHGRRPLERD